MTTKDIVFNIYIPANFTIMPLLLTDFECKKIMAKLSKYAKVTYKFKYEQVFYNVILKHHKDSNKQYNDQAKK